MTFVTAHSLESLAGPQVLDVDLALKNIFFFRGREISMSFLQSRTTNYMRRRFCLGQIVESTEPIQLASAEQKSNLNLEGLSSGNYILRAHDDLGEQFSQMITINK